MHSNRTKIVSLAVLAAFVVSFAGLFIKADHSLFYYGRNLTPHGPIYGFFCPQDRHLTSAAFPVGVDLTNDGMPLVSKGCVVRGYPEVTIDSMVSYGFNDSVVVAEIIATDGGRYYWVDTLFSYTPCLIAQDSLGYAVSPTDRFGLERWVDAVNDVPLSLIRMRTLSLLLVLIGLLTSAVVAVIFFRRRQTGGE